MIVKFFDWCGRNIETVLWLNILLLIISAGQEWAQQNFYPMGLCAVLVALMLILRR